MNVDSIRDGVVIDHITAGRAMTLYNLLALSECDGSVAVLMNVPSKKLGRKDIIKIDAEMPIDTAVVGYADPGATVNIIRAGELAEKMTMALPDELHGVIKCKNPRCISSTEQELEQIFRLTDRQSGTYRCIYCETKYSGK